MDKLLTLREAAELMGISYSTCQRLAKAGNYGFMKIGNSWRIGKRALYRELGLEEDPPKERSA